ncbi:ATP-binding protein [Candidatus Protochlamydia phocaeensis]|uniref:ATP-binding protein n=1 Tax=Candidatus Protochlamydia phocaeensis TaxID=1414722 RepID=UPI0008382A83|nr:ATP-binding protein [Candidatus Protochlamydia phocaeensis]
MNPLISLDINYSPSIKEQSSLFTCEEQIRGTYAELSHQLTQAQNWHDFENKLNWYALSNHPLSVKEKILHFLALKGLDAFYHLFNQLKEQVTNREDIDLCNHFFSEISNHYITNAADSLLQRLSKENAGYEAILDIRLLFKEGRLRLEVEDNGIGIAFEAEQNLFKEKVTTKKDLDPPQYGGGGIALINVNLLKDRLKGQSGFLNKGQDQGAKFWFEASLENCKQGLEMPAYQQ